MIDIKQQLLTLLSEIKGTGSFVSNSTEPFLFPGLHISGVDEISFPITAAQVKEMIRVAHKAPFGKGSKTVLDTTVRSAWEIDAGKVTFKNPDWTKFIEGVIAKIKPDLGIEEHYVSATLYKLLIYETGDFFVAHMDSEKEKGMFGSLIIGLPCYHTGGELLVRFDGRESNINFSEAASAYTIPFAAFYADCEHEIKPITSGYRVCLVYNLVQNKDKEKITINPVGSYAGKLAAVLKTAEDDEDKLKIVLLGHQYTPANFTMKALKLNDRPKAEALIKAAEIAGFYVKFGLITSYQVGALEMNHKRSSRKNYRKFNSDYDYYGDEELSENGTMGEVYDEYISMGHWMEQGIPPLRNIKFEEKYLISPIALNEDEPVEKHAEGYTGNAGMEMEYWYHYGAVFLWPKKYHHQMLINLDPANKLEWIDYYNKHREKNNSTSSNVVKELAEYCMQVSDWIKPDLKPLVQWLIDINDVEYLLHSAYGFLTNQFEHISEESWLKLFEAYPQNNFDKLFRTTGMSGKPAIVRQLLEILSTLLSTNIRVYGAFVNHQIEQIPAWLNGANLSKEADHTLAKDILLNVCKFEKFKLEDNTWLQNTTDAFTRELNREYANKVLLATIIRFKNKSPLAARIMVICKNDLKRRVSNKPVPPKDWARPVPVSKGDNQIWTTLSDFLRSPTMQVFNYASLQSRRTEMEQAIRRVSVDLKMETIKKGSPHTLRLTKTQDAYRRELAKWEDDVELLEKVERW